MYDADAAVPIEECTKLRAALAGGADIAIGSRLVDGAQVLAERSNARVLMSRVFHTMVRRTTQLEVRDAMCGFKLFRRAEAHKLFAKLTVARFAFDIEILALAVDAGLRIAEVPVIWRHNPRSRVRPVRDGLRAARDIGALWARRRLKG